MSASEQASLDPYRSIPVVKKILIGLVVVIVVLCGVIAMQPADYSVKRSTTINAPAAAVFAQVNDFHKWNAWSPWEKLDTTMKKTFEGPPEGQGSIYKWVGNSDVGEGMMTISHSMPTSMIDIKLDFIKPFASTSDTHFAFAENAGQTTVDWTMTGKNNFVSKAFCLFMGGMDKMIGPDFEKGLAALKTEAEKKG
jgi:hypothetical protein